MTWISVDDQLPDELEDVIVFDQVEGKSIAHYFKKTHCFIREFDGLKLVNVKCYVRLPEDPILYD